MFPCVLRVVVSAKCCDGFSSGVEIADAYQGLRAPAPVGALPCTSRDWFSVVYAPHVRMGVFSKNVGPGRPRERQERACVSTAVWIGDAPLQV